MGVCASAIPSPSFRSKPSKSFKIPDIDRLHPEILEEIFLFCLPDDQYVVPDPMQAPLLVSGICQYWREVALSTPALWSSLNVPPRIPTTFVHTWLGRAGLMPLSLSFRTWVRDTKNALAVFHYVERWQHIQCYYKAPDRAVHDKMWPKMCAVIAPLLETFQIEAEEEIVANLQEQLSVILMSATRLRIYRVHSMPDGCFLRTPWSQLTELEVKFDLSAKDCLTMLRQCPKLVRCSVGHILLHCIHSTCFPPQSLILLDQLRSFSIDWSYTEDLRRIFDHLVSVLVLVTINPVNRFFLHQILPTLEQFDVFYDVGYDTNLENLGHIRPRWQNPSCVNILSKSSCGLRTLHFDDITMSEDDLIECLRCTSSTLVNLEINNGRMKTLTHRTSYVVKNRLLNMLTRRDSVSALDASKYLCPKLDTIRWSNCVECSKGVLATAIKSRFIINDTSSCGSTPAPPSKVVGIKVVKLRYLNKLAYDIEQLMVMKNAGLDFTLGLW
jgi:hypothetical protein